jgi:hypothetical protein
LIVREFDEFFFFSPGFVSLERLLEEEDRDMGRRNLDLLASGSIPTDSCGSGSLYKPVAGSAPGDTAVTSPRGKLTMPM